MMVNNQLKARGRILLLFLACLLLVIAFNYQHMSSKKDTIVLLQLGEPSVTSYQGVEGVYESYAIYDQTGAHLGYGVVSNASGYGGPITVLTIVSKEGTIDNVVLIDDSETPLYLKKVLDAGYLNNLRGKSVAQPLKDHKDIELVSGATRTTEGILLAVEKGMYQVGENQLGLTVPNLKNFHYRWQDGLVIILLLLAIFAAATHIKKLRPWILVISVFVLGFMENSSLSIGNYMSIIFLKVPAFFERPIWYVTVVGGFLITLLWGINFYCSWLCPFGAAQEGIYRALHLVDYKLSPKLVYYARKSRWFFLWLAFILALLFNNSGVASYEPFSVFFDGDGNTSQWLMMLMILGCSIFVLRFWCRCFCPMGALLDFVANSKRKINKLLKINRSLEVEQNRFEEYGNIGEAGAVAGNSVCLGCQQEKVEKFALSTGDKLMAMAIMIIWVLTIGALLQNVGNHHSKL